VSAADSTVFIIDDDAQVRASLENLCRSVNLSVETFGSTDEFLRRDLPQMAACLVLDVRFPGSAPSGLEFQRALAERGAVLPIIFITGHGDVPMSVQAMKYGAVDFLLKPFREQELLDAIRAGIARDRQRLNFERKREVLRAHFDSLTPREREIMMLVAQGLPNKQIAATLDLSEVTVKVHRGHVMLKMDARSVADLVRMSDRLIDSDPSIVATDTKG
jgi:FixJ family two-component response regulator